MLAPLRSHFSRLRRRDPERRVASIRLAVRNAELDLAHELSSTRDRLEATRTSAAFLFGDGLESQADETPALQAMLKDKERTLLELEGRIAALNNEMERLHRIGMLLIAQSP